MHIFLVNDDGVGAKGIMALYRAALERGHEVTMCAPKTQQSAASHRFTLADPLFLSEYPLEGAQGYAVTGTPADCVRVGMQLLREQGRRADVLISGVNDGYNAGIAVHYSGTVGAAMEGAFHHVPSIAASIHHKADDDMLRHMARYTVETAERYAHVRTPRAAILNLNAPCVPPARLQPAVYAPLDSGYFTDGYERRHSPRAGDYFWLTDGDLEAPQEGTDCWYLDRGHITLTLMGHFITHDQHLLDPLGL